MTLRERVAAWRARNFLAWDLGVGIILSVAAFLIAKATLADSVLSDLLKGNRATLYAAIAQVSGALLGFVITAISVVFLLFATPPFERFQTRGHGKQLLMAYFHAMVWLAILTFLGFAAILLDTDSQPRVVVSWLVFATMVITALRVWRCVDILRLITLVVGTPSSSGQPPSIPHDEP